jgi:acetate kinase
MDLPMQPHCDHLFHPSTSTGLPPTQGSGVLTVNGGSSSLKFALFSTKGGLKRIVSGRMERIGMPDGRLVIKEPHGQSQESHFGAANLAAATRALIDRLNERGELAQITVVGHRVVHGGSRYFAPAFITPEMLAYLRSITAFNPDHLPGQIEAIEALGQLDANCPQVACFDTAFHHNLPRVAQQLAIPRRYEAGGVRRYGFHGISYEYLMEELARQAGTAAASGRLILAHLGSGASMAAVFQGQCVETTMGLTPAAGLVMGTRCGDIDPGLVHYLMHDRGLSLVAFQNMVNKESGMLGVSETSPDLRDLLAAAARDVRAAEAVELFCYRAKTWLGSLAAAMGGVDTLVFSGGIGENSAEARRRICTGLEFLGIALDEDRNATAAPLISTPQGRVAVRVIPTDEELRIARAALDLLPERQPHASAD